MTRKQQFVLLSLLLLLSRFYDVFTTYLYIPDLEGETNVLGRYLHSRAGWPAVILVQSILVMIVIWGLYIYLFRFRRSQPAIPGLSFKEYISYIHFNDTRSFYKILYSLPVNRNIILPALGFVASGTLIVSGFVVGSSTLLLLLSEKYEALYRMGIPWLLYLMIAVTGLYFSAFFYRKEYRYYQETAFI